MNSEAVTVKVDISIRRYAHFLKSRGPFSSFDEEIKALNAEIDLALFCLQNNCKPATEEMVKNLVSDKPAGN